MIIERNSMFSLILTEVSLLSPTKNNSFKAGKDRKIVENTKIFRNHIASVGK